MKLDNSQLLNMQALVWLEQQGNDIPSQKEIDEAEKIILIEESLFRLAETSKNNFNNLKK